MLIRKGNFVTAAQTLLVLRITLDDHVANGFRKYIYACDLISTVQNTEISFPGVIMEMCSFRTRKLCKISVFYAVTIVNT